MELIFTEESFRSFIGAFRVCIPPELCPSVIMIKTYKININGSDVKYMVYIINGSVS